MAANPLIALQAQVPDVGKVFSNALLNINRLDTIKESREQAPLRQRTLEATTATTEAAVPTAQEIRLKSVVNAAVELNRIPAADRLAFAKKRRANLIAESQRTGNPANTEDTDLFISKTESGDLAGAQELIDNSLRAGQQLGLITTQKAAAPIIKTGTNEAGEAGFFSVTPTGATQIPGITPIAKAPLVTISEGGAGAEQKELGKLRAQDLKGIRARGDVAQQNLNSLNVLDNIDVKTGTAEPMKQAIASFASGFGIDASGLANIAAGQAFTSEAGKVVLRVMATQKGPQTDKDQARIARTLTRLGNQPEANEFINDSARAIANRSLDHRDFFDSWLDNNDTLKGAASAWNKLKRDSPMVSQHVQNESGLPVFFFRFRERVTEANPGATEDQILNAWRRQEKEAKKARK